ncbi:MAG: hypothetical protein EOP82_21695 [Variovorax sp.]|nr:MAG: hypothetical protein EOP82_21695 [Variovorax sp.]
MTNSLFKSITTVAAEGSTWVPAQPYVPPTPERTVYEMRTVCGFRYSGPGHYVYATDPDTGATTMHWVPDPQPGGGYVVGTGTWACSLESVPVTYPASPGQPYVPGHYVDGSSNQVAYNLGWNAGARSLAFFTANGSIEFKARTSVVGAIVGINIYDGVDAGYNGNNIDYAFYLGRGQARIIQNGVMGAYVGTYTDATVFKIVRTGTGIEYFMAGVSKGTATGASTASAWMEASLYSGDDEIFDPVLTQISAPDTTAQTGDMSTASISAMTFFGTQGTYSEMGGSLSALTAAMQAGFSAPSFAIGSFALPEVTAELHGVTGERGAMAGSLSEMKILAADHSYGEMGASLEPLVASMDAYEGNLKASMNSVAGASSEMRATNFLVVTMNSVGTISSAFAVRAIVHAEMLSSASLGSTMALKATIHAVMMSLARSGTVLGVPDSEHETWVLNVDGGGTTAYTNYGFNSYAMIGGRHYGAGPDGIFLLDGDTDAGEPIRASVGLGKLDFGTARQKTISHCYVGMSAKGNLFMKVIAGEGAEAREYVYKTRGFSESLQQQRIVCGKGLKANYVEVEFYNEEGADFELDTVEFHVADLTRRI